MAVLEGGRLFRYDNRDLADTATGQLESALIKFFGTKYALAVCSGTAALVLAILGLDLPAGSEIVCPAFGFPATASAVILAGHKPRLVGVDSNLHFDIALLRRTWSTSISAIIVVHMRGFASEIDSIVEFAKSKDVPVIEDAVPALGGRRKGQLLGTFGNVGCFSTQSDKTVNTGEGGFLVTNDEKVYERSIIFSGAFEGRYRKHLKRLRHIGSELRYPLYNFRMDELRATLALTQMREINPLVDRLRQNYDYVNKRLANLKGLRMRAPVGPGDYLGDSLVFFVDVTHAEFVAKALAAEGIAARYFGSMSQPNVRVFWNWRFLDPDTLMSQDLEASRKVLITALDVPLSPRLRTRDLKDLIVAVRKVIQTLNA